MLKLGTRPRSWLDRLSGIQTIYFCPKPSYLASRLKRTVASPLASVATHLASLPCFVLRPRLALTVRLPGAEQIAQRKYDDSLRVAQFRPSAHFMCPGHL